MSGESENTHSDAASLPRNPVTGDPSTSLFPNRNPEKRPVFGSPSIIREGLNTIPVPINLAECRSFDFMDEGEEDLQDPEVEFLDSEAQRRMYLSRVNEAARDLFASKASYNCRSIYLVEEVNWTYLRSCVALGNGYDCRVPERDDRMWKMPQVGYQAVPMIWFEYGFRLPMHPFFLSMYEALGCGLAQLAPNAIAQISGFISRCAETRIVPTLSLFFSIYRAKYTGCQVYLDKLPGCVALVKTPSSNSGWHPRWLYFSGGDLQLIGPWVEVPPQRLKDLNDLPKLAPEVLNNFVGLRPRYSHKDFRDLCFLESHNRKNVLSSGRDLILSASSLCLAYVLF